MCNSSDKVERVKALKNGKGLQYLVDGAYKIFENPLLLHDLEYNAIAHTENRVTDDLLWQVFVDKSVRFEEAMKFLKDESIFDVAASTSTMACFSTENMKYDRLFGKVYNKYDIVVGAIVVVACYKPLEEDDFEAFDFLRQKISTELGKIKFYHEYGRMRQEDLICHLVSGEIEDKEIISSHVEIVYRGLKWNLYLAVADIIHIDPEYTKLQHFKDLFEKTQPEYKYAVYSNYILILISTDNPDLNVETDLARLNRLFKKNNIYAGISSCFENLFELQKYYNEALSALNNGVAITSERIFLYEQFNKGE